MPCKKAAFLLAVLEMATGLNKNVDGRLQVLDKGDAFWSLLAVSPRWPRLSAPRPEARVEPLVRTPCAVNGMEAGGRGPVCFPVAFSQRRGKLIRAAENKEPPCACQRPRPPRAAAGRSGSFGQTAACSCKTLERAAGKDTALLSVEL